jgi:perosamine synthetase
MRIPLASPEILQSDIDAVVEVLRTPQLAMGPKLAEFERDFAGYLGCPFAVAVNSGTSALHLIIRCLNLQPGDEVIVPSFAFPAVTNVLLQERLTPVFVDIDADTRNPSPTTIEAAIGTRTRAILIVHTFGRPADVEAIIAIADRHGIPVIEDACEALGAELGGKKVGTYGHAGVFAFYPNKQITTGEGGMLVTADPQIAQRSRLLRSQARDDSRDWLQQHAEVGYSYRIADLNCALGIAQLKRIDAILQQRENLAADYDGRLRANKSINLPSLTRANGRISWFGYVIQLQQRYGRRERDTLWRGLLDCGIGAGRYFPPLHGQPILKGQFRQSGLLAVTEAVSDRVLALPFFTGMSNEQLDEVCDTLESLLEEL